MLSLASHYRREGRLRERIRALPKKIGAVGGLRILCECAQPASSLGPDPSTIRQSWKPYRRFCPKFFYRIVKLRVFDRVNLVDDRQRSRGIYAHQALYNDVDIKLSGDRLQRRDGLRWWTERRNVAIADTRQKRNACGQVVECICI